MTPAWLMTAPGLKHSAVNPPWLWFRHNVVWHSHPGSFFPPGAVIGALLLHSISSLHWYSFPSRVARFLCCYFHLTSSLPAVWTNFHLFVFCYETVAPPTHAGAWEQTGCFCFTLSAGLIECFYCWAANFFDSCRWGNLFAAFSSLLKNCSFKKTFSDHKHISIKALKWFFRLIDEYDKMLRHVAVCHVQENFK